jgi:hypothetical protein
MRGGGGGVAAGATTAAAAVGSTVSFCRRWRRGCRKWSLSAIGGGGATHQGEAQLTGEEAQLTREAT